MIARAQAINMNSSIRLLQISFLNKYSRKIIRGTFVSLLNNYYTIFENIAVKKWLKICGRAKGAHFGMSLESLGAR